MNCLKSKNALLVLIKIASDTSILGLPMHSANGIVCIIAIYCVMLLGGCEHYFEGFIFHLGTAIA